jgi:hypothetical protein
MAVSFARLQNESVREYLARLADHALAARQVWEDAGQFLARRVFDGSTRLKLDEDEDSSSLEAKFHGRISQAKQQLQDIESAIHEHLPQFDIDMLLAFLGSVICFDIELIRQKPKLVAVSTHTVGFRVVLCDAPEEFQVSHDKRPIRTHHHIVFTGWTQTHKALWPVMYYCDLFTGQWTCEPDAVAIASLDLDIRGEPTGSSIVILSQEPKSCSFSTFDLLCGKRSAKVEKFSLAVIRSV